MAWRRRDDSARTRRKNLISAQVATKLVQQMMEKAGDGDQRSCKAALAGREGMPGMGGGMRECRRTRRGGWRRSGSGRLGPAHGRGQEGDQKMFAETGGGTSTRRSARRTRTGTEADAQARERSTC